MNTGHFIKNWTSFTINRNDFKINWKVFKINQNGFIINQNSWRAHFNPKFNSGYFYVYNRFNNYLSNLIIVNTVILIMETRKKYVALNQALYEQIKRLHQKKSVKKITQFFCNFFRKMWDNF